MSEPRREAENNTSELSLTEYLHIADRVKVKQENGGQKESELVYLHEQTVTVDWQKLPQRLKEKLELKDSDLEFLSQYEPLDLKIWTDKKLDTDWFSLIESDSTHPILLAEGLISNHDEWKNSGVSFVHRLFHDLQDKRENQPLFNKNYVVIAMSCPGFGGTRIKNKEKTTKEQVSSKSYTKYLDIVSRLFNIKTAAGHSAGGEAVLELTQTIDTPLRAVAFHPAIGIEAQKIFSQIKALDKIQKTAQAFMGKAVPGYLEEKIISYLVGLPLKNLTEAQKTQLAVHIKEKRENPEAYVQKLIELALADTIDFGTSNADIPLILLSSNDVLTTEKLADGWFDNMFTFLKEQLAKKFQLILPDSDDFLTTFESEITQYMKVSKNWGHDAIFFDLEAQDVAVNLLMNQIENSLLTESDFYKDIAKLITFLQTNNFPLKLSLIPSTQAQQNSSIEDDFLLYTRAQNEGRLAAYAYADKVSIRHKLEHAEIAVKWQKAKNILSEWQLLLNDPNDPDTQKAIQKIYEQSQELVDILFDNNVMKPYLADKHENKKITVDNAAWVAFEVFFEIHGVGNGPELVPREIVRDQEKRLAFRIAISSILRKLLNLHDTQKDTSYAFNIKEWKTEVLELLAEIETMNFENEIKGGMRNYTDIKLTLKDLITLSLLAGKDNK